MKRHSVLLICILVCIYVGLTGAFADVSFLDRPDEPSFRLLSYNPYWDAVFRNGIRRYAKADEFERVLAAIEPDIAVLQEISPTRNPQSLGAIFNRVLPLPDGETWFIVTGSDNAIVSRFPITWNQTHLAYGSGLSARGHVLAEVDLPESFSIDTVAIAGVHFKSGGSAREISARTNHADMLTNLIRSARLNYSISPNAPVILAGDFNAYATDPRRHIQTLVHGDINDESEFGSDGSLDPSGDDMVDLQPTHNRDGETIWTWRDDTQLFEPYHLDRILYTGSLIRVINSFVLNTAELSEDDLAKTGLEAGDVALRLRLGHYDHLPLVADFTFTAR